MAWATAAPVKVMVASGKIWSEATKGARVRDARSERMSMVMVRLRRWSIAEICVLSFEAVRNEQRDMRAFVNGESLLGGEISVIECRGEAYSYKPRASSQCHPFALQLMKPRYTTSWLGQEPLDCWLACYLPPTSFRLCGTVELAKS